MKDFFWSTDPEHIELVDPNGNRTIGVLTETTPTNYKVFYKGVETDYPRPFWKKVEARQHSVRFKAYVLYPLDQL